jgi:release factor glutamine methyltransferase
MNRPEESHHAAPELTVAHVLQQIGDLLAEAGIVSDADAELLVGHILGESRGRVQALAFMGAPVSASQHASALALAAERAQRVPLQHLTGKAAFRSLELSVGPGVFVPRPETETVTQLAIDALATVPDPRPLAVDLCTGSAAIALSLAHEVPTAEVWAIEKSPEAYAWAERNVEQHGDGRVHLVRGDVADTLSLLAPLQGRVHVLVSNPPYVPDDMVPRDPEVRDHDPGLALYGGHEGLDLIRVISRVGLDLIASGGLIVLEHAEGQGAQIRRLLTADGWRAASTHQDLTLRDRATIALR